VSTRGVNADMVSVLNRVNGVSDIRHTVTGFRDGGPSVTPFSVSLHVDGQPSPFLTQQLLSAPSSSAGARAARLWSPAEDFALSRLTTALRMPDASSSIVLQAAADRILELEHALRASTRQPSRPDDFEANPGESWLSVPGTVAQPTSASVTLPYTNSLSSVSHAVAVHPVAASGMAGIDLAGQRLAELTRAAVSTDAAELGEMSTAEAEMMTVEHKSGLRAIACARSDSTVLMDVRRERGPSSPLLTVAESSEIKLDRVFDASLNPMAILSLDGRFLASNARFAVATGFGTAELRSLHVFSLLHPRDLANALYVFNQILRGELSGCVLLLRLCVQRQGVIVSVLSKFGLTLLPGAANTQHFLLHLDPIEGTAQCPPKASSAGFTD